MKEILITIGYKDRPSELCINLFSLYNQTYQDFDILILDDCSGTPLSNYHFLNCIFSLLKMQGHNIFIERSPFPYGVSRMRHECAEFGLKKGYQMIARLDDDVFCENDYLEKLKQVINQGYDIASGVTPMPFPQFIRNSDMLKIGNRVVLENGEIKMNSDDYGMMYTDDKIIPSHHFRSSALMKREVLEKIKYYPTRLSNHGFREEEIFSFKAICEGFKIGNHLNAISWHINCQSGGERFANSNELIKFNETILKEDTKTLFKKYGNFINQYNERIGLKLEDPDKEEFAKNTNLIL